MRRKSAGHCEPQMFLWCISSWGRTWGIFQDTGMQERTKTSLVELEMKDAFLDLRVNHDINKRKWMRCVFFGLTLPLGNHYWLWIWSILLCRTLKSLPRWVDPVVDFFKSFSRHASTVKILLESYLFKRWKVFFCARPTGVATCRCHRQLGRRVQDWPQYDVDVESAMSATMAPALVSLFLIASSGQVLFVCFFFWVYPLVFHLFVRVEIRTRYVRSTPRNGWSAWRRSRGVATPPTAWADCRRPDRRLGRALNSTTCPSWTCPFTDRSRPRLTVMVVFFKKKNKKNNDFMARLNEKIAFFYPLLVFLLEH